MLKENDDMASNVAQQKCKKNKCYTKILDII